MSIVTSVSTNNPTVSTSRTHLATAACTSAAFRPLDVSSRFFLRSLVSIVAVDDRMHRDTTTNDPTERNGEPANAGESGSRVGGLTLFEALRIYRLE